LVNDYIYSTDDSENSSDDVPVSNINDELRTWAVMYQITHLSLKELLKILNKNNHNVPKDPRSLLKTPRTNSHTIKDIDGGQFHYFTIVKGLKNILDISELLQYSDKNISLMINVDGIPIHKSTNMQFWPILIQAKINKIIVGEPFIADLFVGNSKPLNIDQYLVDFIEELQPLLKEGFVHDNSKFTVDIENFICDSPARQFLKCVKSHSGYSGCDQCIDKGEYLGEMNFPSLTASIRTDEEFVSMIDKNHHK
jgi:hypothetical protein